MPIIFLSYRRRDSQTITRKIHQHLTDTYGPDAIFLDDKSIPKGEDVRAYIRDMISQCAIVLPVIAGEWLNSLTTLLNIRLLRSGKIASELDLNKLLHKVEG
ncbi:toll/interleukin-1 receptor domain-containing protein [Nodosilinea sp. LEGE 07088]|uniref:TIR domain-containing protein n=1 Tax=Nodosilinea sp. LEGE 07088 TaxID=2777968 RepID=UPI00187EC30D|nr:TIR domain-containing protein [Nodosilinea sp. LEGE 07088]MBE9137577.1 toll/interleukin-1 receptor domain-containing protein [Nodosilinea sp. LEGE 07088]